MLFTPVGTEGKRETPTIGDTRGASLSWVFILLTNLGCGQASFLAIRLACATLFAYLYSPAAASGVHVDAEADKKEEVNSSPLGSLET